MTTEEKLSAILAKCVEINGLEPYDYYKNNKPNVFFEYSGQAAKIKIYFYTSECDDIFEFCVKEIDKPPYFGAKQTWYEYTMAKLDKLQRLSKGGVQAMKPNPDVRCCGNCRFGDDGLCVRGDWQGEQAAGGVCAGFTKRAVKPLPLGMGI